MEKDFNRKTIKWKNQVTGVEEWDKLMNSIIHLKNTQKGGVLKKIKTYREGFEEDQTLYDALHGVSS